ncbi:hypothetical protein [Streptomyces sp. NPDC052496]|uniref:hypothetical protein n=1 Tax=Streptomyces sp. NPDC052496 TaxID=3154951 RepID=UPI00341D7929
MLKEGVVACLSLLRDGVEARLSLLKDGVEARLDPLKDRHIDFVCRYLFGIAACGPGQSLCPFRYPGAAEDGEDDGD